MSAYTHEVSEEAKENYDALKESLLNALGQSIPQCVEEFYAHGKRSSLFWPDAVRHVKFIANRLMPLKPLSVIEAPNGVMAFDLVGPFPRSKDGFKYVLTGICLHSKFPEGMPLKDVKAETVAEGLVDIFCRTGVPKKILTYQGTQFVGHLMQQLCKKLKVKKLQTTTYHPQTNGCLERWHGTLVPMLKKSLENKLDWAKQLKYALFACGSAPNHNTDYSPFEVVYGPFEVVYGTP